MSKAEVPALTAPARPRKLRTADTVLPNGLRVVVVRKPGVPLVEVRLRIPFLGTRAAHPARASLLSDTMLTGAGDLSRTDIAATVQGLGGDVSVGVDADRLQLGANVLSANLRPLLTLIATVLTTPTYQRGEVAIERDRLVEKLAIARSRPGVIASEALGKRLWGEHPYAVDLPTPEAVAAVTPAQLQTMHRALVRPHAAVLVLVGDIAPARALALAGAAFGEWEGRARAARVPSLPWHAPDPLLVVDRPGSVQTSIRFAAPALTRTDDRYPALQLANLIFGGYFSSRWTENIREDKGYTYGPHSRIDHHPLGSVLGLDVEVASEVTAPAMLETLYELGRIASLPVTAAEVDAVRQYAIGTLALSTATQAGLASTLVALAAMGLDAQWLAEHPRRLAATTVEQVSAAAAEFFAPSRFTGVLVGDAASIGGPLSALAPVEIDPGN